MLKITLLIFAYTAFATPELSDRIRLEKVHGPKEVKVIRAVGMKEEAASVGDMLYVGDTVVTMVGQIVELSAFDQSKWTVAPSSRLKLESRKPDSKSLFYWTFHLLGGAMWGEVPKEGPPKGAFRLKAKTKFAAMGIRGTEYLLGSSDKLSTLDVLEGTVWWGKDVNFSEGSFREVKAGQHAEMGPDGKIVVHSSNGDKSVLATRYGVVPGIENASVKPSGTMDECFAKGKGWKSGDGSRVGECIESGE